MSDEQMNAKEMFEIGRMMRLGRVPEKWLSGASSENQEIYRAIRKMHQEGRPCDLIQVAERLREKGLLEKVGGYVYLTECWEMAAK